MALASSLKQGAGVAAGTQAATGRAVYLRHGRLKADRFADGHRYL